MTGHEDRHRCFAHDLAFVHREGCVYDGSDGTHGSMVTVGLGDPSGSRTYSLESRVGGRSQCRLRSCHHQEAVSALVVQSASSQLSRHAEKLAQQRHLNASSHSRSLHLGTWWVSDAGATAEGAPRQAQIPCSATAEALRAQGSHQGERAVVHHLHVPSLSPILGDCVVDASNVNAEWHLA